MQKSSPSPCSVPRQDIRFRREILIQAQQVVQQIDDLEDQLEIFSDLDSPAFKAWQKQNLPVELERLEAMEQEHHECIQFHNDLVAVAKLKNVSMPKAFAWIHEELLTYANAHDSLRQRIELEREKRRRYIQNQPRNEDSPSSPIPHHGDNNSPPADEDQIKQIYRKLARRLHPDLQGPQAEANEVRWQKRIWNLAQQARQRGNLQELETLHKVTLLRQMDFAELTVAEAHDVYAWLRAEFDRLSRLGWQAQQSPAWGFSRRQDLPILLQQQRQKLQQELALLAAEVEDLKGQHAYLEVLSFSLVETTPRKRAKARSGSPLQLSLFE